MTEKRKSISIKKAIASTKFPKVPLTKVEHALIARENKRLIDDQHRREVYNFHEKILKPLVSVLDQAKSLSKAENANFIAQLMEQNGNREVRNLEVWRINQEIQQLRKEALSKQACNDMWSHGPPYTKGVPKGGETTEIIGGDDILVNKKATVVRPYPNEGTLSVGIGAGRLFGGVYPAPFPVFLWSTNKVRASIIHIENFPAGPLDEMKFIDVTVHMNIGDGSITPPVILVPAKLNGYTMPVWILGTVHLTLWGYPPATNFGPVATGTYKRFLRIPSPSFGSLEYEDIFDLDGSLALGVGADKILVTVKVCITAGLTGKIDDLSEGFACADFRDKYESPSLVPLQVGGGPIKISNMDFCSRPIGADSIFTI